MMSLLFNAVSSFSAYPLIITFFIGLIIAFFSGLVGFSMTMRKIISPGTIQLGWSSIIVTLWFLGGLVIFFTGVIGLYLAKVFQEVKGRPQYVIRRILRSDVEL